MGKTKGLGRGLDALMGDAATLQSQEAGSVLLPISQVEPGLNQPRKRFDEEALADLASSIEEHGIIQPLTVRRLSTGYYQIIAGERRWRAAKLAGRKEVPVVIIEADDRKVMELGLIENLQREDLNPIEEAEGYLALLTDFGLTQEELAARTGLSVQYISYVERGKRFPRYDNMVLLLNELKISADEVFCDVVDKSMEHRASYLSEKLFALPSDEKENILDLCELLIQQAEKRNTKGD